MPPCNNWLGAETATWSIMPLRLSGVRSVLRKKKDEEWFERIDVLQLRETSSAGISWKDKVRELHDKVRGNDSEQTCRTILVMFDGRSSWGTSSLDTSPSL